MTPDAFASCLEQLPTRPVVVASHPRSGTHLMIDVIRRHFKPCRGWKWPGEPFERLFVDVDWLGLPRWQGPVRGEQVLDMFPSILIRVLRRAPRCVLKTHFSDGPSAWWGSGNNDPYREIFLTWLRPRATLIYVHRPGRSVLASHYQQHIQREDSRHLKFSDWLRMKDEAGRSRPLAWAAHVGQWAHRSEVSCTYRAGDLISDVGASVRSLADAIGLEPDREPRLPKAWQSLTARRLGRLLLVSPESTAQLGCHRGARKPDWSSLASVADEHFYTTEIGDAEKRWGGDSNP